MNQKISKISLNEKIMRLKSVINGHLNVKFTYFLYERNKKLNQNLLGFSSTKTSKCSLFLIHLAILP
jgi:hypothetical protein